MSFLIFMKQIKFEFVSLFAAELRKKSSKVKKSSVKSLFGIFTSFYFSKFVCLCCSLYTFFFSLFVTLSVVQLSWLTRRWWFWDIWSMWGFWLKCKRS